MGKAMTYMNLWKRRMRLISFSYAFICSFSLFLILSSSLFLIFSCEGIDCTVNNVVTCKYTFYTADGNKVSIADTLTVTAEGTDSVLYNRGVKVNTLSLPMSHWQETDTLYFLFKSSTIEDLEQEVILYVSKSNTEHFENPDCPTTMFHQLLSVDFISPSHCVDSVVIANPTVNYDSSENIKIYLHTNN